MNKLNGEAPKRRVGRPEQGVRWTVHFASSEFGRDRETLSKLLRAQSIIPGEDGCYSTLQIVRAFYQSGGTKVTVATVSDPSRQKKTPPAPTSRLGLLSSGRRGLRLDPPIFLIVRSGPSTVLHLPLVIAGADPVTTERYRFQDFLDLRVGHWRIAGQAEGLFDRSALNSPSSPIITTIRNFPCSASSQTLRHWSAYRISSQGLHRHRRDRLKNSDR